MGKKIAKDVKGEIEFFHDRKEYGFVSSEEHEDDFMFSVVSLEDNVSREKGEEVVFDVMDNYDGNEGEKRAVNIRKR